MLWRSAGAVVLTAALGVGLWGQSGAQTNGRAPVYGYQIVHVYPHDPQAFTQGLEYREGFLYEGTGLHGRSSIRKVELQTGKVLQEASVAEEYFGEGITVIGKQLLELTWQSKHGFVYDLQTFQRIREFEYPGEGWGLTHDSSQIYMSDGSADIRLWDTGTLRDIKRISVHDGAQAVTSLNELEYVKGEVYANVWETDRIAMIAPSDGHVTGWIELPGLLSSEEQSSADVLNGIAYDAAGDRLFITGKLWPKLFEIRLVRKS